MPRDYRAAHPEPQPHDQPPDPDAPDCPGKCNAAYRAAEARREAKGTPHDLQPHPGQPVWCPACVTSLRGALADWPDLADRLREEVESGVSAALTEYVSGSKSQPVHEHEAASFLLNEFAEWAGEWEDTVRNDRELPVRRAANPDPRRTIAAACTFLLANLDWHLGGRDLAEPDLRTAVVDFGTDLLGYHRRARALTGMREAEPVRCDGVPCPLCGYNSLAWEVEDNPSRRQLVQHYVTDPGGDPVAPYRPLGPGGAAKVAVETYALMAGAVTGDVYCRRCKPVFRMTPLEYERYTRQWAADPLVRGAATPELLAEVFGGSVPTQYAKGSA
jgi:hypothetical protein